MNYQTVLAALIILCLGLAIGYLFLRFILKKEVNKVNIITLTLEAIKWAETHIIGTKAGQERLKYVCGKVNAALPKWLQPVITPTFIENFVNRIFETVKQELEEEKEEAEDPEQINS